MSTEAVKELFDIEFPIIAGGMIWCSGWELTAAVSNAGGLGLLGSGSMKPDTLRFQIKKAKESTNKAFGVNVPLISPYVDDTMKIIIDEGIGIVFTSAGNPKTWTKKLQDNGITVVHVVAGCKFAIKSQDAGVDAIVAEGFEAGGHNGREETTTMTLLQMVKQEIDIPIIAAGGISSGKAMLAAIALGADGVQIGSRFVASTESSAHGHFKQAIVNAGEGDTKLTMKKLIPVRLLKNDFFYRIEEAERAGAGVEELQTILGRSRAQTGMFEGDMTEGELEIGQVSALINEIKPASEIIKEIIDEYNTALTEMKSQNSL